MTKILRDQETKVYQKSVRVVREGGKKTKINTKSKDLKLMILFCGNYCNDPVDFKHLANPDLTTRL